MRSLTLFSRRRAGEQPTERTLNDTQRHELPPGYDAVAEALVAGRSPVAACAVVGRDLASDGVSLGEALSGLAATYDVVGAGGLPDFAAVESLGVAWSEATLDFLHDVTCEDPLTGLASAPHLRTRLTEVYRGTERAGESIRSTYALVVVDVPRRSAGLLEAPAFGRALGLAAVAEVLREVFAGDETVARLGSDRVAALVRRSDSLGESVARVRSALARLPLPSSANVWIEGLPGRSELGVRLLAELAG